jgi:F-type H+-transporting ATPase subunit a
MLNSSMLALAAEGGHGGGGQDDTLGDVIMHHLTDASELWGVHLPGVHIGSVDLSISKLVIMMWLAALVVIAVVQLGYRRGGVPHGLGNFLEVLIVFVRDDIVGVNFGPHGKRYVPFFLTLFFFILMMNLLGLVPWMSTATGNVNVTGALALCTLGMIHGAGMRKHGIVQHWKNQMPPGIPVLLFPIMIPVELIGMLTKPFALMIRLFANMTAGHVVILALFGIIIDTGSFFATPVILFPVAITLLEIFIAFLQAYIFTFLSAIFISSTVHGAH